MDFLAVGIWKRLVIVTSSVRTWDNHGVKPERTDNTQQTERLVAEQSVQIGLSMCPFLSVSTELRYQRGDTNVCHYSNSTRKVVLFGLSSCPQNTGVALTHVSETDEKKKVYTFNVRNHSVPRWVKRSMVDLKFRTYI